MYIYIYTLNFAPSVISSLESGLTLCLKSLEKFVEKYEKNRLYATKMFANDQK